MTDAKKLTREGMVTSINGMMTSSPPPRPPAPSTAQTTTATKPASEK